MWILVCPSYFVGWVREYSVIVLCSLPSHSTQYVNLIISFTVSQKLTSTLLGHSKESMSAVLA